MTGLINRAFTAAALAAALSASSAVLAQDGGNFFDRMFGRTDRPAAQDTTGQGAQGATTEQVLRIERLEAQIRQMTGTIEQLQYRNQQLEAHVRRLEGGAGPQAAPQAAPLPRQPGQSAIQPGPLLVAPAPAPAPAPGPAPGRRSDAFDPNQNPNAPGAPRPLGGIPAEPPPVVTAETPVGAPGGRTPGAPLDLSTLATGLPPAADPAEPAAAGALPPPPSRNLSATGAVATVAPPSESPKDYYDLGYGYVMRKDYALAEQTFDAFLKKFPSDRRAADAQFWVGESLFQRQRYDQAASAFLDLSTKHASHAKAPDALLRLGQSLAALNQKEMACATLAEVSRKYPRASNTVRQGVEREQKRARC